jgi:hypothetical protein
MLSTRNGAGFLSDEKGDATMLLALLTALTISQATGSFSDGPIANMDTYVNVTQNGTVITAAPLNAAVTTDGIKTKGYRWVQWTLQYTYATASAVTMQCQQSEDNATWANIQALEFVAFPVATSATMVWSEAVSASGNWVWTVPNHGVYMRCTFNGTGASSSDTLTPKARVGI